MKKSILIAALCAFTSPVWASGPDDAGPDFKLQNIGVAAIKIKAPAAPEVKAPAPAADGEQTAAERMLARLAALLKGKDVIQMPPAGARNFANELTVKVEILDCPGDNGARRLTEAKIKELLNYWKELGSQHATSLTSLPNDGVHVAYEAGQNNMDVRNYLVDSLVKKQDRSAVGALLDAGDFGADFARIGTYNIDAEIIGREIIIIKPWDASRALVIDIEYAGV